MPAAILRASSKLKNGFYEFQPIRKKCIDEKIVNYTTYFNTFYFCLCNERKFFRSKDLKFAENFHKLGCLYFLDDPLIGPTVNLFR